MSEHPFREVEVDAMLAVLPERLLTATASEIEHALFADAIERQSHSPFLGAPKKIAEFYAACPALIRQLHDERDDARSLLEGYEDHKRLGVDHESLNKSLCETVQSLRTALQQVKARLPVALTEQRQQLGAMHDETIVELERVRGVAKTEIESLQAQLAQAERERDEARAKLKAANLIIEVSTSADPGEALNSVRRYIESSELWKELERLREVESNWNDAVKAGLIIVA